MPKKYEFEQIIADRISSAGKEYLVKWKGYVIYYDTDANLKDTRVPKTRGSQRKICQCIVVKNMNLKNRSHAEAYFLDLSENKIKLSSSFLGPRERCLFTDAVKYLGPLRSTSPGPHLRLAS